MTTDAPETPAPAPSDFIRDVVAADVASGKVQRVITRFPPEPNGYLHIGHAKSICLNFGIAREFGGLCNLRMDDTNPAKEEVEYVESIIADVKWLIGGWADDVLRFKHAGDTSGKPAAAGDASTEPFYASDYFQQLHDYAVALIKAGKAYVCDLTPEQTDAYRGAPGEPGKPSPWRDRSVEENLDLFARMKAGEFPDGARTLRAKIDMAHPNVWMRDPLLYRIRHTAHHHTGDAWCIYPLYDYAHCLSDSIEGVTHSVCTLEFEVHRPLYDWIVDNLPVPQPRPHQYEFAKLMPTHVVISKRKLLAFVNEGVVSGWDDPRMPTLSGLRRRGVTPEAIRDFVTGVGVTKFISSTDYAVFEHAVRSDLNARAQRRLAVLQPIKVVITNYPEGQTEELTATNNPTVPESGTRPVPFSRELWIEQEDFAEVPPPKFFRLKPGGEVRLKYAYIIKCEEVVKDADGRIVELRCTADLDSKSGGATSSRKVKGTIHWVSAPHAVDAEVRLYDRLFHDAEPESDGRDWRTALNPHSLEVVTAKLEPSLKDATLAERYQFERLAYFTLDSKDSAPGKLVFNRIITLKDTWAKEAPKG
ncbi:MAG: glutamine--tRNA ligase/YqeY domain fusion protein [Chthoniobacter sp.]|uniref:glutamine--tRNA ligase/YqeY domain fusion protein n=1 Tax=Chthoniobacter sp. TaxID=2510640 RepID=UPI0032A76B56